MPENVSKPLLRITEVAIWRTLAGWCVVSQTKSLDTRRLILDGNASEGESDSEEILVIDVLKEGGKAINTRRGKTRRSDSSALGTEDGPRSRRASSSLVSRPILRSSPSPRFFPFSHLALQKAQSLDSRAFGQ
jgi:hypothetical protein